MKQHGCKTVTGMLLDYVVPMEQIVLEGGGAKQKGCSKLLLDGDVRTQEKPLKWTTIPCYNEDMLNGDNPIETNSVGNEELTKWL